MSKTIIHILNTGVYSGAENVVITIINEMKVKSEKYDFVYVSLAGSIGERLAKEGIKYEMISRMTTQEIKRVINKYNPYIIHAHDYTASIICALTFTKIQIVSHLHNNASWLKCYGLNSFAFLLSAYRYKKILHVSDSILDDYVFSKFINKKSITINNPVNINKIIELSMKESPLDYNFDVIYLGRLSPEKNPLKFLNLINDIVNQNISITAALIGDGSLYNECKNYIDNHNLQNNIQMLGFMENPYTILRNTKILCMTSKWEGYGLAAVEALALGKPVVATPVGGLLNIINNSCGMLSFDNEVLENEIIKLLKNGNYYIEKSNKSLDRANDLNNITQYIDCIYEIYNALG